MAVTTWTAGEVLTAADLNDTFASKLPYSYGTATPSTTDSGFLWYDSNSTPAAPKFWDGSAFQALTSGKILQVVRATYGTNQSTTSTSYIDATGLSVTITPSATSSVVLLIGSVHILSSRSAATTTSGGVFAQITDSSNNAISGAEGARVQFVDATGTSDKDIYGQLTLFGYATPATTSAVTYKLRFRQGSSSATANLLNADNTGQLYAIEVSA